MGGKDSRERASQVGAVTARAVKLNTKTDKWPPLPAKNFSSAGGGGGYAVVAGAGEGIGRPPLSAPKVTGMSVTAPQHGDSGGGGRGRGGGAGVNDEVAVLARGGGGATGNGSATNEGWSEQLVIAHETSERAGAGGGGGEHEAREEVVAGAGAGGRRVTGGRGKSTTDMWRGGGEGVLAQDSLDFEQGTSKQVPPWIYYVPLVLIMLEPARKGIWDTLASSRHAHAQLQSSWEASAYSKTDTNKAPENEAPQAHTRGVTPRGLEHAHTMRPEKLKVDAPRAFRDRLMGPSITNVQWRSSLRSNSNVMGLELGLKCAPTITPRHQAAKDVLRDPPASEQAVAIGKGRKLTQSISASSYSSTEPAEGFAVRIMRQHCFLACAGSKEEMEEYGKLVLQGPLRPVPLVLQPDA